MTIGGEEGAEEEATTSLDTSNAGTPAENTGMTNMADIKDTRGKITTNFALLLAVEEGDRISHRQTTTTDAREEKIATVVTMDTEMTTTLRREVATGETEGEVGVAEEDVVTTTTT